MEPSVTLPYALGQGEENQLSHHVNRVNHVDADADAKANNKQRRKVQNRRNQRAHRES